MTKRTAAAPLDRAWRDGLVLVLGGAALFGASIWLDAFDWLRDFSERHEAWEIDELLSLVLFSSVAGVIFAVRRTRDLRREMADRAEAEAKVRELALHDALTGLANRRKLYDAYQVLREPRPEGRAMAAALVIDLDRFKPINDLYGHGVGDRLLKMVADRISGVLRQGELAARLGGDEFAVILAVDEPTQADRPARRILQALEEPFAIDGLVCRVGASIGIATAGSERVSADELIHRADVALYRAKQAGRNQACFFEQDMNAQLKTRARLELDLRTALTTKAIGPYYQPLVELATGRIRGYEILARWKHPVDGTIPPSVFIPIAEDTGLIGDLTAHIFRQACRDGLALPKHTTLALNISPMQLRDRQLPERLLGILRETGFPPARLEVELTENALVADFESARTILNALKAHGVSIALDDFGTGYSSLHHLRELPFDKLKIDRTFVTSMCDSEESRKIIDAIIGLGRSLGLTTVAEGVETKEEAESLLKLGCTMGQGFLYGVPVPATQGTLRSREVA
ncbi:MAG: EAL domain-containing protein [Alphaproteobacteria bacterium]|nr:EAL domain-containing protein [Alphaproteobacteria bacterium]